MTGAIERQIPIVIVLLDGAAVSDPEELPESIRSIGNSLTLRVRQRHLSSDLSRLVERIEILMLGVVTSDSAG